MGDIDKNPNAEVFISYSSQDRKRVMEIAEQIQSSGVSLWLDRNEIKQNYGVEIVQGIKNCKVLMIMCSDASMRSRNVKQEIQLAWKYERSYIPIMLEEISFPEELEYWLEGWQWVEVMNYPKEQWLPKALNMLVYDGVNCPGIKKPSVKPVKQNFAQANKLNGLQKIARYTDQMWPIPLAHARRGGTRSSIRGLGTPQDDVQHRYRIGDRVCLVIESEIEGYLTLLDEGPEGITYCLCPSQFAPNEKITPGRMYLPQENSRYDSFVISGEPGRENLLAIITDEPLELNWMSSDRKMPARVLNQIDIDALLARLHNMEGDRWTALSTYFDIVG